MKKYLFEIDIVKCDMPLSAAVLFMSGQKKENKSNPEDKKIMTNDDIFNIKMFNLEFNDTLLFNGKDYDYKNNILSINHDGTVNVFPKIKGQSLLDLQYLDRNRVLATSFYDRSAEELYVFSFVRQREHHMFVPDISGYFTSKIKINFNNFPQMLEFISYNIQRRWAVKPDFNQFDISIQTNQYPLNNQYLFLDSSKDIILVKKKPVIDLVLISSRLQNDFDFILDKNDYEIRSDCAACAFKDNSLLIHLDATGYIEILPKKFNRILFDGYSIPLEDEHTLIKVVEG